jgi:hypothetical protein
MKFCEYDPRTIFTTLLLLVTYKEAQKALVLHYTMVERLAGDKHSCLLYPFVI